MPTPVLFAPPADHRWDQRWDEIVAELTRRRFLAGAAAAGLVFAGCTDDDSDAPSQAATRLVDSANGKITVPERPQRIVCVDAVSCAVLLELGVTPVGVPERLETTVALDLAGQLDPITKVIDLNIGPDLEKVAQLTPDLILGAADAITPYDKLSQIAPTVLINQDRTEAWAEYTAAFAAALGLGAGNDDLRRRYDDQAARIRREYAETLANTRWAIAFGIGEGKWWLYYPDSQSGSALTAAGARFTDAVDGEHGNFLELSTERLGDIADADAIVVAAENDGSIQSYQVDELFSQPLWKTLPAVESGHVFGFARLFPQSYGGAIDELDEFENALKTLGGTSSTASPSASPTESGE